MASYSDNFNRVSLGADWSLVDGGWETYNSQQIRRNAFSSTFPAWTTYVNAMDSLNHYAQIDWEYAEGDLGFLSPVIRCPDTSNKYGYEIRYRPGSSLNQLIRRSAAGNATLASLGNGSGPPKTMRLQANGAIFSWSADSAEYEYEDVDHENYPGLYVGLCGHSDDKVRGDSFIAEDLASSSTPTLSNPTATVTGPNTATVGCTVSYS
jgi:hypothetical protein